MVRCPFSLERILRVTADGKVVYRTEKAECRPFAFEAREGNGKPTTVVRNFELFEPLDFIAEVTQHIPDPGEHIERRDQAATVEKILRHCGLWTDPPPSRAPPPVHYTAPLQLELLYLAEDAEPYDEARYDASG
jgi:hypothetical protein